MMGAIGSANQVRHDGRFPSSGPLDPEPEPDKSVAKSDILAGSGVAGILAGGFAALMLRDGKPLMVALGAVGIGLAVGGAMLGAQLALRDHD